MVGHAAPTRSDNYYPLGAPFKAPAQVWGSADRESWYLVADLGEVSRVFSRTDGMRTVMGEVVVVGDVAVAVGSDGVYGTEQAEGAWNCDVVFPGGWCRADAAVSRTMAARAAA